jgi:ornithine cyclodeaminase
MIGSLDRRDAFGVKLVSLYPDNPKRGLPSHLGVYVLYRQSTGAPLAMLDADVLTSIRTAAASIVATRHLMRSGASRVAILGAGTQALEHLDAFATLPGVSHIDVWARRPKQAGATIARSSDAARRLAHVAEDVRAAVECADIVCTVTSSAEPILAGEWLLPGTHVNLVGSSFPTSREADDDVVARSRFVVDSRESAASQAGELRHALDRKRVAPDHVCAEIGEVIAGQAVGRRTPEDITVYKSLGVAAQDVAAALVVLESAV